MADETKEISGEKSTALSVGSLAGDKGGIPPLLSPNMAAAAAAAAAAQFSPNLGHFSSLGQMRSRVTCHVPIYR